LRPPRGAGRRQPVDDGGALVVDLDAGDERADELLALVPVEPIDAVLDPFGEILEPAGDGSQGHGLDQLLLRFLQIVSRPMQPHLDALGARGELLQLERPSFVGVDQALETTLVAGHHAGRFVTLSASLGLHAVGRCAARPLLKDAVRLLQHLLHRFPDVVVELIGAHLWIRADAPSSKSVGIRADAAVVGVLARAPLCRGLRNGFTVESVTAAGADHEPLQQVASPSCISLRQPTISLQLLTGRGEHLDRDDRRHADVDPLLRRLVAICALAPARSWALAPDRAQQSPPLDRLRLPVRRLTDVGRVAEKRPYRGTIPARRPPARRDCCRSPFLVIPRSLHLG
jgi:hypothetical protein